ncbi:MAG: hypothetical protein STHCBS139747_003117 [Sporothrix thermara]
MSSPQSTTSHEGDNAAKKNLEQITFRFCAECSNMLYPKEDEDSHKLQFTCRTCQYTEEAASTCVFRNVLNNAAGETAGVTQDVGSDPTVGVARARACASASAPAPLDAHSPPPSKAVLCFCCGALIACRSCGELFCKPPSSPTMTSASASTTMTTADTTVFSPTLRGLDDLDLYPDDSDILDVCSDDYDYEFMEGTEYGNRDDVVQVTVM